MDTHRVCLLEFGANRRIVTLCRVLWLGVVAPERPTRLRLNVGMTLPIGAAS